MNFKHYLLIGASLLSFSLCGQSANPYYSTVVNQVSQESILNHLQEFENLGVKTTGSANVDKAFDWLKSKYLSFGYEESQISTHPFTYQGRPAKNLILTKTGTKYPNTYVIICGHYDTVVGPGTNDNGSGVSVILEIAKLLREVSTEYSIKFINFSGEEQGLIGSRRYVSEVVNGTQPKMDIKLVFNIDEVGGVKNLVNNKIYCERDEDQIPSHNNAASDAVTRELMNYVNYYSELEPVLGRAYSSDYMPFEKNGEVITGFFEYHYSPHAHTSTDVLANMDPVYVYRVAKAATGAMMHFSVAQDPEYVATIEVGHHSEFFRISPNPAKTFLNLEFNDQKIKNYHFSLYDVSGKLILKTENEKKINITEIKDGLYIGTFSCSEFSKSQKILIEK